MWSEATAEQRRVWIVDRHDGGASAYVAAFAWTFHGPVHPESVRAALQEVYRETETLRSRFRMIDGRLQVRAAEFGDDEPIDVVPSVPEEWDLKDWANQPLDLEDGPVFRARLWSHPEGATLGFALHHAVVDGWSIGALAGLVRDAYARHRGGATTATSAAAASPTLADIARWDETRLRNLDVEEHRRHWRDRLVSAPQALAMPFDRPRRRGDDWSGRTVESLLDPATGASIAALARARGTSAFAATFALTSMFLAKWCNENDIVVGVPTTLHRTEPIENAIGFFVNTVPLRLRLDDDPTVAEVVERAGDVALDAVVYQDLPLSDILDVAQVERTTGRHPLFQVLLTYQNLPQEDLVLEGNAGAFATIAPAGSKLDLSLNVIPSADGVRIQWEYRAALFEPETIVDASKKFLHFLRQATAEPDARLSTLRILTPEEEAELYPPAVDETRSPDHVLAQVRAAVLRDPQQPALETLDGVVTRRELWRGAEKLTARLLDAGVRKGDRVAVHLSRHAGLTIAPLAIWMAGGVYVPLDPRQPVRRRQQVADRSGVRVAIVDDAAPFSCTTVTWDGSFLQDDKPGRPLAEVTWQTDLPAYLLFTSGSSGEPKGVLVGHRALAGFLTAFAAAIKPRPEDRMVASTTTTFDISLAELFLPIVVGACSIIAPESAAGDPLRLAEFCAEREVSIVQATPSVWSLLAPRMRGLRIALCGGEALDPELSGALGAVAETAYNVYGPTEATIWSSVWRIRPTTDMSIGTCLNNNAFMVVDRWGCPVAEGVVGELLIGGPSLAVGYWENDDLTTEKFEVRNGRRWYRTGDLATRSKAGGYSVHGRTDQQLKVRGFRVEPGEIEAALNAIPGVTGSAVVASQRGNGHTSIVGFVSAAASPSASDDLRVAEWQAVWDSAYAGDEAYAGWVNSITSEPYPAQVMDEWIDLTVRNIGSVTDESVLEVGCGTGLITKALSGLAHRWVATDISSWAIDQLSIWAAGQDHNLEIRRCAADGLTDVEGDFDVIILNSVIQYFPSERYLHDVISTLLSRLAPRGRLYIGDVRSPSLGEAQARAAAAATSGPGVTGSSGDELLVHPAWFVETAAGRAGGIRFPVKAARHWSEMTAFRYDVVVERVPPPEAAVERPRKAWPGGGSTPDLATWAQDRPIVVTAVPNAANATWLAAPVSGVVLTDLERSAAALSVALDLAVDLDDTERLAITVRDPADPPSTLLLEKIPPTRSVGLVRSPSRSGLAVDVDTIREALLRELPDYMVPSRIEIVPELPRMPNGKIDRGLLRARADAGAAPTQLDDVFAPSSPLEKTVLSAWCGVLGVTAAGASDHFFRSGGDSLGAVRLLSRLKEQIPVELSLADVIEKPQLGDLIRLLESRTA
jgi:amino acid adenylation domain-containing protein